MVLHAMLHNHFIIRIMKQLVLIIAILLTALMFLLFGIAFWLHIQRGTTVFIWCAWANLVADLPKTQTTKIYVFEDDVAYQTWFALRDSKENFQIIKINDIPDLAEDKAYFLPRGFDEVKTATDFEGEQFYIAFRDKNFDHQKPPLQTLISKGYKIGEPKIFEAQGLKAFLVLVEKVK